mgnify:CR=1 FL=1
MKYVKIELRMWNRMIGSTKYTTLSESEQKTSYSSWIIITIIACIIVIIIFMPKLMEDVKEKKYREAEIVEKVNESRDNELFKLLKENNIFVKLKVLEDKDDKEGLLGQGGQYIAKAVVGARIGDYIRNTEALTVEVFNNKEDLKLRVAYLQAQNNYLDGLYNDKYGCLPQTKDNLILIVFC